MREIGFSKLWPKLAKPQFTTFRFTRRDKNDWHVGEVVRVVYRPRSHIDRSVLGLAVIEAKEQRAIFRDTDYVPRITNREAKIDGFEGLITMEEWLRKSYPGDRLWDEPMNKLTLAWTQRWLNNQREEGSGKE